MSQQIGLDHNENEEAQPLPSAGCRQNLHSQLGSVIRRESRGRTPAA
jgi:hypothetical protein